MNRFTRKCSREEAYLETGSEYVPSETASSEFEMYYKLGQLEDIEEDLGCPLIALSIISKNGFYCEYGYIAPRHIYRIDIFRKEILYYDEDKNCFSVKLSDHKKTWWLKEDRSE